MVCLNNQMHQKFSIYKIKGNSAHMELTSSNDNRVILR